MHETLAYTKQKTLAYVHVYASKKPNTLRLLQTTTLSQVTHTCSHTHMHTLMLTSVAEVKKCVPIIQFFFNVPIYLFNVPLRAF